MRLKSWLESVAAQRSLTEASKREAAELHAERQLSLQEYLTNDEVHNTHAAALSPVSKPA